MTADTPRLSRQRILEEGTLLLGEAGIDGLSMRKLADRLGVVPMALYRHVTNKEDLLDGILDLAVQRVVVPSADLPWRAGMEALAHSMRSEMLENAAIARLVVDHPDLGPAALDIGEYAFGLLMEAGFSPGEAERSLNLLLTFTLGFAALESQRIGEEVGNLESAYDLLAEERYPNTKVVRPNSARTFVGDEQFAFGLARVLDGLEALRARDA